MENWETIERTHMHCINEEKNQFKFYDLTIQQDNALYRVVANYGRIDRDGDGAYHVWYQGNSFEEAEGVYNKLSKQKRKKYHIVDIPEAL